jgi:hypothetical protein
MSKSIFLKQLRQYIRMRGYSFRTEKTYLYWVKDFIRFNNRQHTTVLSATFTETLVLRHTTIPEVRNELSGIHSA